ncbi:MAG TPA: tripartite tricarboxylate transporter substrate binding protein [Burkholderiales bacterium]|nr:tripartite tricarboxylate transporter substrate binding protein [Burkholderiales bacterium]
MPFSAGSAVDTLARIPGQKLAELWGQQVVVDNRVGANGIIGTEAAAKAPADGYTLVLANDAGLATSPALYPRLPYDPRRDFAPIALAASIPVVLVVNSSFPAASVKELVSQAKANPGKIHYASGGNGSAQHLPMEMFKLAAGIDLVHVPYKGLGPAFNDVVAGQIPVMFAGMSNVFPHLKSGRIRALAIGSAKRSDAMPELPTMQEAGVAGFDYAAWAGFLAPAGTPVSLIDKLNNDLRKVLGLPEVREKLVALGFEVSPGTPQEFGAKIEREMAKVAKVVKQAGIRAD